MRWLSCCAMGSGCDAEERGDEGGRPNDNVIVRNGTCCIAQRRLFLAGPDHKWSALEIP